MLKEADKVHEYLKLGIPFDHLELNIDFSEYLNILFKESYLNLKSIMSDFDAFQFLMSHHKFKKRLLLEIIKENSYSLLLIVISYFLSWFFILFFSPNVISLVKDFGVSFDSILIYQYVVSSFLAIFHLFIILICFLFFLLQFKDLKTVLFIITNSKVTSLKTYVSYRFALMLLLFLEAGIKTQSLIQIMRTHGLGDLSKWVAYHIQESLDQGEDLRTSFKKSFIDKNLGHFISLGVIEQNLESALKKYLILAQFEMEYMIKNISRALKLLSFLIIIVLLSLFYLVLYYPLGIMEAL